MNKETVKNVLIVVLAITTYVYYNKVSKANTTLKSGAIAQGTTL